MKQNGRPLVVTNYPSLNSHTVFHLKVKLAGRIALSVQGTFSHLMVLQMHVTLLLHLCPIVFVFFPLYHLPRC